MPAPAAFGGNRLLGAMSPEDRSALAPYLEHRTVEAGSVLYDPGDDVETTFFPCLGTVVSHVLIAKDGTMMQAATVGAEGAIGGIISAGQKPAFARMIVLSGGPVIGIATDRLEKAKSENRTLDDLFSRYADALLAQIMQSVVCNGLHELEQRCCRWLLVLQDRMGDRISMTQEMLAEMLGVQRTTVSRVAVSLRKGGAVTYSRGRIEIVDRARTRAFSCECYDTVEAHFRRVLPENSASSFRGNN